MVIEWTTSRFADNIDIIEQSNEKLYPKTAKNVVLFVWLRPRCKILEFFTITPILTSALTVYRRNRGDPSSLHRTYGALQVLQKHSRLTEWASFKKQYKHKTICNVHKVNG